MFTPDGPRVEKSCASPFTLLCIASKTQIMATIGMWVSLSSVTRSLRRPSDDMHSRRGRMKIRGIKFWIRIRKMYATLGRLLPYQRRVEVSQSVACRRLKNVHRIHKKILLPRKMSVLVSNPGSPLTDLACAMTLEKLSLKILIRDVIRRMLVMQTKMSCS